MQNWVKVVCVIRKLVNYITKCFQKGSHFRTFNCARATLSHGTQKRESAEVMTGSFEYANTHIQLSNVHSPVFVTDTADLQTNTRLIPVYLSPKQFVVINII